MSGVVSFILKGQDQLSSPIAKLAVNSGKAKNVLDKLTASNKQLNSMLGNTSTSITQVTSKIDALQKRRTLLPANSTSQLKEVNSQIKEATEELQKLQMQAGNGGFLSKIKSGFGKVAEEAKNSFMDIPGARFLTNPLVAGGAAISAAVGSGMADARAKLDFRSAGSGGKQNDAVYDSLRKSNALIGGGAIDAGKTLLGGGVKSGNIANTVNRLGAVSGGDAGKLNALSAAFAQVNKDGKLTEETLQAMNDNGFKPLTILADKNNMKLSQMQKLFANGKVNIDMLNEALQSTTDKGGAFGNVLEERMKDPSVKVSMLMEKLTGIASDFGVKVLPLVTGALEFASKGFDYLGVAIDTVGSVISSVTGFVKENADVIWAVAGAVGAGVIAYKAYQAVQVLSYMWTMRSVIAETAMATVKGALTLATGGMTVAQTALNAAFLASPIGWVVAGVAALTGGIILAWNKFEGFRKVIYGVWETMKYAFNQIGSLFKKIFSPIGEAITALKEGRWLDAAKATGKLLYNITPVGLATNTASFVKEGGFSGIKDAYNTGAAKGAASFKASKDAKQADETFTSPLEAALLKNETDGKSEAPGKIKDDINAVSGGGQKTINVHINKVIETFIAKTEGTPQKVMAEMEQVVEEVLVRIFGSLSRTL